MIGVGTRRRSSPAVTARREVLYASRWLCVQRLRALSAQPRRDHGTTGSRGLTAPLSPRKQLKGIRPSTACTPARPKRHAVRRK
jgi:hypothetical protein